MAVTVPPLDQLAELIDGDHSHQDQTDHQVEPLSRIVGQGIDEDDDTQHEADGAGEQAQLLPPAVIALGRVDHEVRVCASEGDGEDEDGDGQRTH